MSYSTLGLDFMRRKVSAWRLPSVADPASLMVVMRQPLSMRDLLMRFSGSAHLFVIPPNRMTMLASSDRGAAGRQPGGVAGTRGYVERRPAIGQQIQLDLVPGTDSEGVQHVFSERRYARKNPFRQSACKGYLRFGGESGIRTRGGG